MTIKQFTAVVDNQSTITASIYGLGDDNCIYYWDADSLQWVLLNK